MKQRLTRGPRKLFFVLVLLPMICVFPYLRTVNNPNEFVRVFTSIAIVENHTFSIDEQVTLWGWVNDMARVPSKIDGRPHYFMVKGPGVVYTSIPGYFVFSRVIAPLVGHRYPTLSSSPEERLWWLRMSTWALRISTTILAGFLFLLWFERYLRDFTRDPLLRYVAVAAFGVGTNYLAYVHMFASHSPYAALAFIAFATTERERRIRPDPKTRRISRAALAGFCASACVAFEYQSLFPVIILSAFGAVVFYRPKRLLAFALGGFVNVPPVMFFHWKAYGNPLTPGHQMLETAHFAAEHKQGLWGILWPSWDHLVALAVEPGFGFFGMSPFMWLGFLGIPLMFLSPLGPPSVRSTIRGSTLVWALACLALFGVNAGFIEWRAGWTVGPRYLVACGPFFAFGAVCAMERLAGSSKVRRAIVRSFGGGLALASVLAVGTVSIMHDTLPETIARPFAQFSLPLARTGFVPHHIGEWFGWESSTLWYIACAALVAAPIAPALWPETGERAKTIALRVGVFVVGASLGLLPQLVPAPADGSPLFVLHPSTRDFPGAWEPKGRDRITLLRNEAERYGPRRPCFWYQLADLDRVIGADAQATKDEERAQAPRPANCPRKL